ncbi:hypothetical protein FRC07_014814 [Ceratobasidium sp. 392]|nr:hypothetical protein FRC07_014814 [Ceratobasidium sp. 392]
MARTIESGMAKAGFSAATSFPFLRPTIVILELLHPGTWSSVPSDATAFVHSSSTYTRMLVMHRAGDAFMPPAPDAA